MGGLRRETSTLHSSLLHAAGIADDCLHRDASDPCMSEKSTDASDEGRMSIDIAAACTPQAVKQLAADLEVCDLLDFSYQQPEFSCCLGVACLKIRPSGPGCRAAALESLVAGLGGVLNAGVDITVTYDFRDQGPSPRFTQAMSRFCLARSRDWGKRLRSTALLVKDNIFSAVAQGPVHGFMRACHLGDSFVVCHGEAVAQDFHRATAPVPEPGLGPASCVARTPNSRHRATSSRPRPRFGSDSSETDPFVCVKEVLEGGLSACMVSLEPFACKSRAGSISEGDAVEAPLQAHTFHMQTNGDVRVIQTPAQSVVVGSARAAKANEEPRWARATSGEAGKDMAALRFHRPREQLAHLAGAHFHAGELVVDAEAEALNRELVVPPRPGSVAVSTNSRSLPGTGTCTSCFEGLGLLLLRLGETICGAEEEEEAVCKVRSRRRSSDEPGERLGGWD